MSFFADRKARKAAEVAAQHKQAALATWQVEQEHLETELGIAQELASGQFSPTVIPLKKGEVCIADFATVGGATFPLVEMRASGGQYVGASRGVSIPIGHSGVRYRVGQSRGHYVPNDPTLRVVDQGTIAITSQRLVFRGVSKNLEWSFDKMIGLNVSTWQAWALVDIAVSNRQKSSAVGIATGAFATFRGFLNIALNWHQGGGAEAVRDVQQRLAVHAAARPGATSDVAAEPAGAPAGLPITLQFVDSVRRDPTDHWWGRGYFIAQPNGSGSHDPIPGMEVIKVAGVAHYADALKRDCWKAGQPVLLQREPDNPYDPNAVQVWAANHECWVGHLPADGTAHDWSAYLVTGAPYAAVVLWEQWEDDERVGLKLAATRPGPFLPTVQGHPT